MRSIRIAFVASLLASVRSSLSFSQLATYSLERLDLFEKGELLPGFWDELFKNIHRNGTNIIVCRYARSVTQIKRGNRVIVADVDLGYVNAGSDFPPVRLDTLDHWLAEPLRLSAV